MARDWQGARAPEELPEGAWERFDDEPPTAYTWFAAYRDMDPKERSMKVLAERNERGTAMFADWSKRWKWVERAAMFDAFMEEQHRQAQIDYVRRAGEQRAELVVKGLDMILARLTGRSAITDPASGEVVEPGVRAIDPSMLEARDLAALGNMLQKMQTNAEEAAGVKPLDEQSVAVKLSFDLGGVPGVGHTVVESLAEGTPARGLPRGEPEPGEGQPGPRESAPPPVG